MMPTNIPPRYLPCGSYRMRLTFLAIVFICLIALPAYAHTLQAQQEMSEQQLEQIMLRAHTQHEILVGLVEQGRYDLVLPEIRKIFALNLPDKEEDKIATSAGIVAKLLVDRKQFALAYKVLDEAFARMNKNMDKATVLYIKARFLKDEGKLDEALATLRQAQALDKIK